MQRSNVHLSQRAVAADPNHALSHSALALALTSLGDDGGARREGRKATAETFTWYIPGDRFGAA